jgi:PAS domain S-box-containing protein
VPGTALNALPAYRDRIGRRLESWRLTSAGRLGLYIASVCLLAALYYAAAKIGLRLAYLHGAVTALWPPVGVGIAALVLYGPRLWPGIVIGDLFAGDYSTPLGTVIGQTVGNTLEVLVAALLLLRLVGARPALERVREVFALVGCAAIGTMISASFGTTSLRLGNVIPSGDFGEVWRTWWLSDLSGALVVAPPILTWATRGLSPFTRRDLLEGTALLALLVLLAELPSQRDVPYVVFPVLIWAALRFGPRGAATALVVVSSLTVWNTAHNAGPFVRDSITDSLLSSQLFIAAAALTSLVLAAVTAERTRADEALRTNTERLRSVVQSMAEGLIVRDARGVITDCNAAAERIIGIGREQLRGQQPDDVLGRAVDAEDRPLSTGRLMGDAVLSTGVPEAGLVARLARADGTTAWVSVSSGPVLDAAGQPEGVVTTLSDITERRRAEGRVVASERATRALADEQAALRRIATLVAAEGPPSSVFERVTEEVAGLLRTPSASLVRYEDDGRATLVGAAREPEDDINPVGSTFALDGDSVLARVRESGRPQRIDDYERAIGSLAAQLRSLGYRCSVAAPVAVGGKLWGALIASSRQPEALGEGSERRLCDFADLVAQALANADAYDKLAASRARIVEAGDAERRRIERNLHDGAQQQLVSVAVGLRLAEALLQSDPPSAQQVLVDAREQLGHALEELRELARGIHPAILTDGGLAPALSALATRASVPVEIAEVPGDRLPEPVEAAAYYLIAEAITNVAKHARASHVAVSVHRDDGRLLVHIADDGVGGADAGGGSGLNGLADRVEALHGRLRIDSPRGGGTRIDAQIPVG